MGLGSIILIEVKSLITNMLEQTLAWGAFLIVKLRNTEGSPIVSIPPKSALRPGQTYAPCAGRVFPRIPPSPFAIPAGRVYMPNVASRQWRWLMWSCGVDPQETAPFFLVKPTFCRCKLLFCMDTSAKTYCDRWFVQNPARKPVEGKGSWNSIIYKVSPSQVIGLEISEPSTPGHQFFPRHLHLIWELLGQLVTSLLSVAGQNPVEKCHLKWSRFAGFMFYHGNYQDILCCGFGSANQKKIMCKSVNVDLSVHIGNDRYWGNYQHCIPHVPMTYFRNSTHPSTEAQTIYPRVNAWKLPSSCPAVTHVWQGA